MSCFPAISAGEKGALCFADPLAAVGQTICWFRLCLKHSLTKQPLPIHGPVAQKWASAHLRHVRVAGAQRIMELFLQNYLE